MDPVPVAGRLSKFSKYTGIPAWGMPGVPGLVRSWARGATERFAALTWAAWGGAYSGVVADAGVVKAVAPPDTMVAAATSTPAALRAALRMNGRPGSDGTTAIRQSSDVILFISPLLRKTPLSKAMARSARTRPLIRSGHVQSPTSTQELGTPLYKMGTSGLHDEKAHD
ncbi:hypothetical protein GCM10010442_33750 [Kitasatospora kifunensis]